MTGLGVLNITRFCFSSSSFSSSWSGTEIVLARKMAAIATFCRALNKFYSITNLPQNIALKVRKFPNKKEKLRNFFFCSMTFKNDIKRFITRIRRTKRHANLKPCNLLYLYLGALATVPGSWTAGLDLRIPLDPLLFWKRNFYNQWYEGMISILAPFYQNYNDNKYFKLKKHS